MNRNLVNQEKDDGKRIWLGSNDRNYPDGGARGGVKISLVELPTGTPVASNTCEL